MNYNPVTNSKLSTDKSDLDDFHLSGNSPISPKQSNPNSKSSPSIKSKNQNTKNKENSNNSKAKQLKPKTKPIALKTKSNIKTKSNPFQPQQRPKTPEGLSKKQAKKWRKHWDYEEKNVSKLRAQQQQHHSSSSSSKKSSLKSSPSTKASQTNKSKQKKNTRHVLPQYDNPHTKKKTKKQALVQRIPIDKDKQHEMFAHLPQNEKYLFYISPKVTSSIHPVILRAGLYYNDGTSKNNDV